MDRGVVLVVEDEPLVQMTVEDALVESGFTVLLAGNGAEAMEVIDGADAIHAVVTDIRLGAGPDGWTVARSARERDGDLPIVYMTGDSAHEWTAHGVPGSVLVQKPFARLQLTTAVANALNEAGARVA